MRVQISNDPLTGWDRYYDSYLFLINEKEKMVSIGGAVQVEYNGQVSHSRSFQFNATEQHMVDVNGDVVPKEIENPDYNPEIEGSAETIANPSAVMTEYAFYIALADTNIGLNAQRAAAIQKLDASGRFNV